MKTSPYIPARALLELEDLVSRLTIVPSAADAVYGEYWSVISMSAPSACAADRFDVTLNILPRPEHQDLCAEGLHLRLRGTGERWIDAPAQVTPRGRATFHRLPRGEFRARTDRWPQAYEKQEED